MCWCKNQDGMPSCDGPHCRPAPTTLAEHVYRMAETHVRYRARVAAQDMMAAADVFERETGRRPTHVQMDAETAQTLGLVAAP